MHTQHNTRVTTIRRGHDTLAFVPRCDCGWEGRPRSSHDEAEADATDHVVANG